MNGSKFWQFLNSPLTILILGLLLLPVSLTASAIISSKFGSKTIIEEIKSLAYDIQNNKDQSAIKLAVSNAVGQVIEGIKGAFKEAGRDQEAQGSEFIKVRNQIVVSDVKHAPSPWATQEKLIGVLTNKSGKPIRSVRLNVLFYGPKGEFIDVKDEWLHGLKVLEPKQAFGFEITRQLGDQKEDPKVLESRKSSTTKVQVASFDVFNPAQQ